MIKIFRLLCIFIFFNSSLNAKEPDVYEKIDLFGEVLEKINKEYIDEVDQSELMDAAINGVLQSLDPYSAYMNPELFKNMQTDTQGKFGGLGIEIGMEAGFVKKEGEEVSITPLGLNEKNRLCTLSGLNIMYASEKQLLKKN